MLWMFACEILVDIIRHGRSNAKSEEQYLNRLMAAMAMFGGKSLLLSE
jgi:hypothetical protein